MTGLILAGGGTPIEGGEPGAVVIALMIALWLVLVRRLPARASDHLALANAKVDDLIARIERNRGESWAQIRSRLDA